MLLSWKIFSYPKIRYIITCIFWVFFKQVFVIVNITEKAMLARVCLL